MMHYIQSIQSRTIGYLVLLLFVNSYGCSSYPKQIRLQYNLEEGEVYRQKTVNEQTVKQVFQGEMQVVKNKIEVVTSYKVISSTPESSELEVSYDTLDLIISLPDRDMHFSSKGSFWRKDDLFSQVMNTMSGKSFKVTINNATGKVTSISGLEKLFEDVLNKFLTGNEEQISSVMEMLNKSYGEGAFRDAFEATNSYFTEKEIKPGDHWENHSKLTNVNAELANTWQLKDVDRKEAILESTGKLLNDESSKEVYVEGMSTKLNLTGSQSAVLKIDHRTGWTNSGKIEQHFEGVMKLLNPETGEKAELPIEMINVITYSTIEE